MKAIRTSSLTATISAAAAVSAQAATDEQHDSHQPASSAPAQAAKPMPGVA
jgi:hypothetical protein